MSRNMEKKILEMSKKIQVDDVNKMNKGNRKVKEKRWNQKNKTGVKARRQDEMNRRMGMTMKKQKKIEKQIERNRERCRDEQQENKKMEEY